MVALQMRLVACLFVVSASIRVQREAPPAWACGLSNMHGPANVTSDALHLHTHQNTVPTFGKQSVEAVDSNSLLALLERKESDIVVVFYAPWCPHCQTFVMHDGTGNATNAPLENFNRDVHGENVKVVKFDGQANQPPAQFDVKWYPSVFRVSKAGVVASFGKNDPGDLNALRAFAVGSGGVHAFTSKTLRKSKLDINQKVYIENAPVLGDGQGDGSLNVCRAFTAAHVANEAAPVVKVCGTGIKATVFLRGRCEGYYEHSYTVGKCDNGAPPSTCDTVSPADNAAYGHYQSYKVEQC